MKTSLSLALLLMLSLSACAGANTAPTPLPTLVLDSSSAPAPASPANGQVTASGVVIPSQQADLAFGAAGRISRVYVREGEAVSAGQVLAQLEDSALQAELSLARSALQSQTSPAAIAAAEQTLANAQKTLEDAQKKVDALAYKRASDTKIDNLQAEIDLAEQTLARAQEAYKSLSRLADGDNRKASALYAMTSAQMRLNALVAEYNWLTGKPTETDAAITRANYAAAQVAAQEAAWTLAALKGETLPPEASGAALSALENAKTAVILAAERLAAAKILAPIDGEVTFLSLEVGEYVQPGMTVLRLNNVQTLQIETTDLGENDVAQVTVGQPVSVYVKALNATLSGEALYISPVADTLGGDVVYRTTITLHQPYPAGLRAGMSVDVSFLMED
jgi:HlyD family secretion protein